MKKAFILILFFASVVSYAQNIDPANWTYIEVDSSRAKWGDFDEPEWLRYFGLSFQDVNHDGLNDIVSGRYVYLNPGGEMTGPWRRIDFGLNADAMISMDVDGDDCADVIAQALPNVYWIEADDKTGLSWKAKVIAQVPRTGHVNGQGYRAADIFAGGKPEAIMSGEGGMYALRVPENLNTQPWEVIHVVHSNSNEGFDCADVDGDGDLDIVAGSADSSGDGENANILSWYENPGTISGNWEAHFIGNTVHAIDRVCIADLNGDGKPDVGVAEEQYPPEGPTAYLFWFEQKEDGWERHTVVEEWSLHNLDIADMDGDGDMDLITSEHQGPDPKTQIFENDGKGNFAERLIDQGKESHLGTRVCDLDNDGDLDIVSIAWNNYKHLHVWRNDVIRFTSDMPHWNPVSNLHFGFPITKTGRQVATLVMDVDKDGIKDFVIASYTGIEWYKMKTDGNAWSMMPEIAWDRFVIEPGYKDVHIEAGGDYYDIDGDGDLDIVMGGSGNSNQVWWWQNPYPKYDPGKAWKRYLIKDEGGKQHHDQIIHDFDGDGRAELFFWNQGGRSLYRTVIPKKPQKFKAWKLEKIFTWESGQNYEGLAKADIDQDGLIDLVGGGLWFKYKGGNHFEPQVIDDYTVSRTAVGDLIEGGREEVVIGSGDLVGPLNMYEWQAGEWVKTTLFERVDHGHTLEIGDVNGDGHLDIYTAEMHSPGTGEQCKQWVLYGNGKGQFKQQLISVGTGTHEGCLGDLDGDGDLDVLQKDFNYQRRITVWLNNGVAVEKGKVRIADCRWYRTGPHFKVVTGNATFFIEKSSGGITSMFDKDGNDWIDYNKTFGGRFPQSSAGDFRGIPNMVYAQDLDSGTGHPGFNTIKSAEQVADNKLRFVSENGYEFSYTFTDEYVKLNVEKVIADQKYWILYEGPVGGSYETKTTYWGTDLGMRSDTPDYLNGERVEGNWQWAYFGSKNQKRVFIIKQETPDELADMLGFLGNDGNHLDALDGMVVFGLGRSLDTKPLFTEPHTFYFGFYENKVQSDKAYKALKRYVDKNLK